jgi:hypothetical protein
MPLIKKYFYSLVVVGFFFSGCKGPKGDVGITGLQGETGSSDKQIELRFMGSVGTTDTIWTISPYQSFFLTKFDKRNYVGVDSVIFTCPLYNLDSTNIVYAELYDVTDSVSIQYSQIQHGYTNYWLYDSNNIYTYLPSKEITLAIRIRSKKVGAYVSTGDGAYIFLFRN